jgi:Eukaryotic cytochrome b561
MRYVKRKLALFFTVQTLAVAAMISLGQASLHPGCSIDDCARPPAVQMILAIVLILGELAVIAAALRNDLPVWHALLGLGVVFLVAAFVCGLAVMGTVEPHDIASILAVWHVTIGLILLAAGTAAAVWDLTDKLRRSDDSVTEDQQSLGMWPLD